MRKNMTLTEALRYTEEVYLEEGWITPKQLQRVRRDALIMGIAIMVVALIPAFLIILMGVIAR